MLFALVPGVLLTGVGAYLVTRGGTAAINGYVLLGIGAVCLLISYLSFRGGRGQAYLMAQGIDATARVLGLEETSSRINDHPVVVIQLQVTPIGGQPPFETSLRAGISPVRLPYVQPGRELAVKVDPNQAGRFAIDWSATMAHGL